MPNKQTYFNKLWLLNSKYSNWILEHDTFKTKARCKDCKTDINLSNMGHTALDKYARGINRAANMYDLAVFCTNFCDFLEHYTHYVRHGQNYDFWTFSSGFVISQTQKKRSTTCPA